MPTENKTPVLTDAQENWIVEYEAQVGARPVFMEELEDGSKTFCEFASQNIAYLRDAIRDLESLAYEAAS